MDQLITLINGELLKLVGQFIYLDGNISFTENYVKISIDKAWFLIDRLSTIWKSDLYDKIKRDFFQNVAKFDFIVAPPWL